MLISMQLSVDTTNTDWQRVWLVGSISSFWLIQRPNANGFRTRLQYKLKCAWLWNLSNGVHDANYLACKMPEKPALQSFMRSAQAMQTMKMRAAWRDRISIELISSWLQVCVLTFNDSLARNACLHFSCTLSVNCKWLRKPFVIGIVIIIFNIQFFRVSLLLDMFVCECECGGTQTFNDSIEKHFNKIVIEHIPVHYLIIFRRLRPLNFPIGI